MARKTIDVAFLVNRGNEMLAIPDSTDNEVLRAINREFRYGVIAMMEAALFESDNYSGYVYHSTEFVEHNDHYELRDNYDDSRRRYFLKVK